MGKGNQPRGSRKRRKERIELLVECLADAGVEVSVRTPLVELETLAREHGVFDNEEQPEGEVLRDDVKVRTAADEAKFRRKGQHPRTLTRQQRRHVERAKTVVTYETDPSGLNRKERRAVRKEHQRRDAESNRLIAEGRAPRTDRTDDLDDLLDELEDRA